MNGLCDVHGRYDSQVHRNDRGLDPPVAISGFHHLPMHGTADGSRLQRDDSQKRSRLLFCTFYDHRFQQPTGGNAHHGDEWLSIPAQSFQSASRASVGLFLSYGHGAWSTL